MKMLDPSVRWIDSQEGFRGRQSCMAPMDEYEVDLDLDLHGLVLV
jgi:hypothetical protein